MLLLENDPELTVALTVHDEVVLIGPNENPDATMDYIISVLCKPPLWAAELLSMLKAVTLGTTRNNHGSSRHNTKNWRQDLYQQ